MSSSDYTTIHKKLVALCMILLNWKATQEPTMTEVIITVYTDLQYDYVWITVNLVEIFFFFFLNVISF